MLDERCRAGDAPPDRSPERGMAGGTDRSILTAMSASRSSYWWDQADRQPHLEAVIFSLDAVLADPRADAHLLAEAVWDLHCSGIRVAVVTGGHWPAVQRPVRDLLGDGAVEVLITGDEVGRPRPDPEVYRHALGQLGVRAADAVAVEDSGRGLRAALAAGLTTVVVTTKRTAGEDFTGAAAVLPGYGGFDALSAYRRGDLVVGSQRLTA